MAEVEFSSTHDFDSKGSSSVRHCARDSEQQTWGNWQEVLIRVEKASGEGIHTHAWPSVQTE